MEKHQLTLYLLILLVSEFPCRRKSFKDNSLLDLRDKLKCSSIDEHFLFVYNVISSAPNLLRDLSRSWALP